MFMMLRRLLLVCALVMSAAVGIGIGLAVVHHVHPISEAQRVPIPSPTFQATSSPTPAIAQPVTLSIPKIHVTAPIETVGLDKDNNMDVPKQATDVGWYEYGPNPGDMGNSVIDGHLDWYTGPAVFWQLNQLSPGDQITVTDTAHQSHVFVVTKKASYPYTQFPLNQVFGATSGAHLNLITCAGTFDKVAKNYSNRVVVYADLKS